MSSVEFQDISKQMTTPANGTFLTKRDSQENQQQFQPRNLIIGQLNLQNSKAAGDEARETMTRMNLDFLLVQEPYSVSGKVRCFGLRSSNQVIGDQGPNSRPMAAIIAKPEHQPLELLQFKTAHFTTIFNWTNHVVKFI